MATVSPSPPLIISACLSGSRSHVKLKAVTDALFKVSSKMVLKCVTQPFHRCGKVFMERLFFIWMGEFETGNCYVTPVWMSNGKQNKTTQTSSTSYLHLYQDIVSLVIFYIKPCLFHQHPKITKYDLGPVKLKQE